MALNNYPYSNFHELNLDWLLKQWASKDAEWSKWQADTQAALDSFMNYFNTLDVQDEIDNKLDEMYASGELEQIIAEWLNTAKKSRYANTNMVVFGDSWADGYGADTSSTRFTTLIAGSLGCTEYNYAEAAAGFTIPTKLISSQLTEASAAMSADEKNNTGLVFVLAGVNDWRHRNDNSIDVTAFANAVQSFVESLPAVYPNATIAVGLCNTEYDKIPVTYRNWMDISRRRCMTIGNIPVLVLENVENVISGRPSCYLNDNLHPNQFGHKLLAGFLTSQLLGGMQDVDYYVQLPTVESDYQINRGCHIFRENGMLRMREGQIAPADENDVLSGSNIVATIPEYLAPRYTTYAPIYYNNNIIGTIAVTNAGNIYLTLPDAVTAPFANFSNMTWQFDKT